MRRCYSSKCCLNKMAGTTRKYYLNPDEDFVLRGGLTRPYSSFPELYSNKLTDTKNLSKYKYHPGRYTDDSQLRGSLSTISNGLNRVSEDLKKSLRLEEKNRTHTLAAQAKLNEMLEHTLRKSPPSSGPLSQVEWYTRPIHLSSSVYMPMSRDEMLATRYFPVTLGETKSLEMLNELKPGWEISKSRSKSADFKGRSLKTTTHREQPRDDWKCLDKDYFLTDYAPHIKAADISFTSPFRDELAQLRMEELHIEEQQYLELKRQLELERIRGPKPKWYELKTPEFHYEASKNNELLRNSDKWDELLHYRENLINASRRIQAALQGSRIPIY